MRIVRLFTGSDGESHLEELDPNLAPDFQSPRVATKVSLTRMPQDRYSGLSTLHQSVAGR